MSYVISPLSLYILYQVMSETGEKPKCRVLFSFYATTVIGVLDSGSITEVTLSMLLPHLSRGMQSRILEYKAASYMILAQMFYKSNLKSSLLKTLQQVICKVCVHSIVHFPC